MNRWILFIINFILVFAIMHFVYAPLPISMLVTLLVFMGLYYVENLLIAYRQGKVPMKRKTIMNKRKSIWSEEK